jgi:hypothetical protein
MNTQNAGGSVRGYHGPFRVVGRLAGGVSEAVRIEMPGGDLRQAPLGGRILDVDRTRAALATAG